MLKRHVPLRMAEACRACLSVRSRAKFAIVLARTQNAVWMPTDHTYACFVMHCKYCKEQLGTLVVHLAERVHAGGGGAVRLLAQAVDFQLAALSSFSKTRLHHILRCQCLVIGQGYTAHHRGPRARAQYYRLQESRQVVQSWPSAAATRPTGYETLSGSGNYISPCIIQQK